MLQKAEGADDEGNRGAADDKNETQLLKTLGAETTEGTLAGKQVGTKGQNMFGDELAAATEGISGLTGRGRVGSWLEGNKRETERDREREKRRERERERGRERDTERERERGSI